jgi:ABC transport system ATP-binding/permease protein
MDQVVDHLFVFRGNGVVKDFPGSYTHYRQWLTKLEKAEKKESISVKKEKSPEPKTDLPKTKAKLSYKEKKEYEQLDQEISDLESEKETLEQEIGIGNLSSDDIIEKSHRIGEIIKLLDEKSDRWLELGEFI